MAITNKHTVRQILDTCFNSVLEQLEIVGSDPSTRTTNVTDAAPAELITNKITGITQLTAPGNTSAINVENYSKYGYTFTVASIDTNVIVQLEGSVDGTNYAVVPLSNTAVANAAISTNQMTITANGTYIIESESPLVDVRLDFVSEAGGTAATIDADFFARRI